VYRTDDDVTFESVPPVTEKVTAVLAVPVTVAVISRNSPMPRTRLAGEI